MISLLHNWEPTTLIFQIGPLSFHWYGLLIGLSLIAGFFIVRKLAQLVEIKPEIIDDLFARDYNYLKDFYQKINDYERNNLKICPHCGKELE